MKLSNGNTDSAYWQGARDARLGHPEWAPIRPYSKEELAAYRQGYADQKATMAMQPMFDFMKGTDK